MKHFRSKELVILVKRSLSDLIQDEIGYMDILVVILEELHV